MQQCEPRVSDYMNKAQNYVGPESPLRDALSTMRKSKMHYLPVLSGRKVVGLLKDNPSRIAASLLGGEEFTAADLMSANPSVTSPETGLYEVLDNTPDNVYGCTVVQDFTGKILGIFTPREAIMAVRDLADQNRAKKWKSA